MTPNLPAHLQEKMSITSVNAAWSAIKKISTEQDEKNFTERIESFKAGYLQAYADIIQELGPVVEAIIFYGYMDNWDLKHPITGDFVFTNIIESDLGVGDFKQPCHSGHGFVDDRNNGGRKAREAFTHLKERILCT